LIYIYIYILFNIIINNIHFYCFFILFIIYYHLKSPNSGEYVYEMELIDKDNNSLLENDNEKIINVRTSKSGNVAVQTSSNRYNVH